MDEQTLTPFERQLSGRLERYARRAAVPFDAVHVAHSVASARPRTRYFGILPRPRLILQIAMVVVLLLVAAAAALLIGAIRGPDLLGKSGLIAFATNGGITVANADGSDALILTSEAGEVSFPTWSPDGAKIAYWSKPSNQTPASLVIFDPVTSSRTVIATLNPQSVPVAISWAPDGMHLAFPRFSEQANPEVMIVGEDGTGLRSVAPDLQASDPAWSPDGQEIAFRALDPADHEIVELYIARLDETGVRPIATANLRPSSDEIIIGIQLDWAPDAKHIAFASKGSPDSMGVITVVDVTAGTIHDLTSGDWDRGPIYSPDGRWIAFERGGQGGPERVGLMQPDGSGFRIFPDVLIAENTLSWSPDGTSLVAFDQDRTQVVVIPIDGTSPSSFPAPAANTNPSWQRLP